MFYPAKKDSTKVSKRIEFPKNCSSTSNNKLWWRPRQFRRCNAFRIIWIIFCIVQTLERTKKRSSTCRCKTSFLNYKNQLKSLIPDATLPTQPQESNQISTNVLTAPNPVQEPPEIIPATPVQASTQVTAPQALSTMATSSSISPPSLLRFWHPLPQWSRCHQLESVNAPSLSNL